jgi:STE24 endopeptidase
LSKKAATSDALPAAWAQHDRRVRPYVWSHRSVDWAQTILLVVVLVESIRVRRLHLVEYLLIDKTGLDGFALWVLYFFVLGAAWTVITLPLKIASFGIDKKAGLSKQSFLSWFGDFAKGMLVGGILGTIVLFLLYACVQLLGSYWWAGAAALMAVFSVVLAAIAPVVLVPLFFKLEPLKDAALKTRLLDLCARFGVQVAEVYHLGLGAKTEKGNAAFLGLGKTKRIAIGDTIYEKYSKDEVEAVFAHELGHQVHNDIWRGIFLGVATLFLSFGVAAWITDTWVHPLLYTSMRMPFGLFAFFLVVSIVQIPLGWLQAAFSRWREREADRFAAEEVGMSVPLASALEKLTFQNHSFFKPSPFLETLTYSHPAPWRRITGLRKNLK